MSDKQTILQYAYEQVATDNKLIRLATLTTFLHSVMLMLYVIYQIYFMLSMNAPSSEGHSWAIYEYVNFLIGSNNILIGILIVFIVLAIWYFLLPPIAAASMIYYIDSERKSGSMSLGIWLRRFFSMFEFNWMTTFFTLFIFLIVFVRVWILWVLESPIIIFILIIWFIIILWVSFLLPYAQFYIVLKDYKVWAAIKQSVDMSLDHFWMTVKYVLFGYILHIRFLFNVALVIGIPSLIAYLGIKMGIWQNQSMKYFIYAVFFLLFLLTAYINWIIEAFFVSYWYKLFKMVSWWDEERVLEQVSVSNDWVQDNNIQNNVEAVQQPISPQQNIPDNNSNLQQFSN